MTLGRRREVQTPLSGPSLSRFVATLPRANAPSGLKFDGQANEAQPSLLRRPGIP
jgi:hypothetical protein